jgi:hypothetical protein
MPRISYRIQAFFWNPGGAGTGGMVRLLKLGFHVTIPWESRVEQEADGSWVTGRQAGAELGFSPAAPRQTGHPFLKSGRLSSLAGIWAGRTRTARIKPESIPGDKIY